MSKVLLSYMDHKTIPKADQGRLGGTSIYVTVAVIDHQSNNKPTFSVQGEIWDRHGRLAAAGAINESIVAMWPELESFVALALCCAKTGQPMYPEMNGWYWFCGAYGIEGEQHHGGTEPCARTPGECEGFLASHLRIPRDVVARQGPQIVDAGRSVSVINAISLDDFDMAAGIHAATKKFFEQWVDAQRKRWIREANAAIILLQELIAKGKTHG